MDRGRPSGEPQPDPEASDPTGEPQNPLDLAWADAIDEGQPLPELFVPAAPPHQSLPPIPLQHAAPPYGSQGFSPDQMLDDALDISVEEALDDFDLPIDEADLMPPIAPGVSPAPQSPALAPQNPAPQLPRQPPIAVHANVAPHPVQLPPLRTLEGLAAPERQSPLAPLAPIPMAQASSIPLDPAAQAASFPAPQFTPSMPMRALDRSPPLTDLYESNGAPARPEIARLRPRPLDQKGEVVIGIDLGTTNSCVAFVEGGVAHVLASNRGEATIPSAVSYSPNGSVHVGTPALERAAMHPKHTILGAKRLVGRAYHSPIVQTVRNHFAYDIVQGENGEAAISLEGHVVALEEISAHILAEIRSSAELQLGKTVNRAVVTCPAFFNERQREAVRVAGELAGFHVERVLSEPTAAALNYGIGRTLETRRVIVYDLGGGTFDVSLLEVDGSVYEVLATGGDTFLGGVDFDACVAELLVEHCVATHGIDPRHDESALAVILSHAERAKMALTERPSTIVHVGGLLVSGRRPIDLTVPVRRIDVDPRFDKLLDHTFQIVRDVIGRANVSVGEVDDILLVGGQTRYPRVKTRVLEFFGQNPKESMNPNEAVALGAAQYADGLDSFDNVILIDALPISIGIGLPGGKFEKLIERDTRLPADTSYAIRTVRNKQDEITILIFQGEDSNVANNEPLGMLVLSGLPQAPKGKVVVDITLRVTEECILELSAVERKTKKRVESKFATKDTPEALRQKLGLAPHPSHDEIAKQTAELENRPKGVWRWLTGVLRQ